MTDKDTQLGMDDPTQPTADYLTFSSEDIRS